VLSSPVPASATPTHPTPTAAKPTAAKPTAATKPTKAVKPAVPAKPLALPHRIPLTAATAKQALLTQASLGTAFRSYPSPFGDLDLDSESDAGSIDDPCFADDGADLSAPTLTRTNAFQDAAIHELVGEVLFSFKSPAAAGDFVGALRTSLVCDFLSSSDKLTASPPTTMTATLKVDQALQWRVNYHSTVTVHETMTAIRVGSRLAIVLLVGTGVVPPHELTILRTAGSRLGRA
jgi:hypothetical protein